MFHLSGRPRRFRHTVLLVRVFGNRLVVQELLSLRKETRVFVVGMSLQEFVPCQTIPDKVRLVGFSYVWCLVIDGIVPSEDRVVHHTHVTRTTREHVVLNQKV